MRKIITLPNGRAVTAGAYARAWKKLIDMDPNTPVSGFDHFPRRAGDVLREIRRALHERITARMPHPESGTCDEDTFRWLAQLAGLLNGTLAVVNEHAIPLEYREQLAHRIRCDD